MIPAVIRCSIVRGKTVCGERSFLLGLICVALLWNPAVADSISLLSQNADRLFDDINDGNKERILASGDFKQRIKRLATRIGKDFTLPEVIALQEVENRNVLERLVIQLEKSHGVQYQVVLIPGQDVSGINLGFLIHPRWQIDRSEQLMRDAILASYQTPLYSRPPLLLRLCRASKCLSIINVHLRSMRGLNSAERGQWVADKRLRQASRLAQWLNRFQQKNPQELLLLVGDFNALNPADRHVDVRGILLGQGDHPGTRIREKDFIERDLQDLTKTLPVSQRYSFIFRGNKQQLDYLLATQHPDLQLQSLRFSRINYRISDHAALFARLRW